MIRLAYELSPGWNRDAACPDLEAADEVALRYDCFLGDVAFVADGADFSARWGWVPVLDFALSLRGVAAALASRSEAALEFTESDATVEFRREGDELRIAASYAPGSAVVGLDELTRESERFLHRMVEELREAHPGLRGNAVLERLAA